MEDKKKTKGRGIWTILALVALLAVAGILFGGSNMFAEQAKHDMEVQGGWGTTRLVWSDQVDTSLEANHSMCLYVWEDSLILAEQSWNAVDGWYNEVLAVVEAQEGRPVQAGFGFYQEEGYCLLYLMGEITDPDVQWEDITYQLRWGNQVEGEYGIREEDLVQKQSIVQEQSGQYFVRVIDLSDKVEPTSSMVLTQVRNSDGAPIHWEDGTTEDHGDWMVVPGGSR